MTDSEKSLQTLAITSNNDVMDLSRRCRTMTINQSINQCHSMSHGQCESGRVWGGSKDSKINFYFKVSLKPDQE